ncbi:LPXTG cell wall anchor domain-containing protein [Erwinia sp. CPCC 100877]|nr:LPXTG cell wall anchor domain-containing protein [Erwinia sp. CPCC 100877]
MVSAVAFTTSRVYADSEEVSEETVQKAESSDEENIKVEETTESTDVPKIKIAEEKLKLWDVFYDSKNMEIIGKTTPYALIAAKSLDNPEIATGLFKADANGSFIIVNPPSGMNRITASLDDKKSDSVDIEVTKSKGEPSLAISETIFDQKTNTFTGKTAPNATVSIYVPSTTGQGSVKADANGVFTIVDQVSPGLVMILTAIDAQGRTGEPYSFRAPDVQALDSLKILQVEYDHETKTLYGKTAPNVRVSIDYLEGTGSSAVNSDENGYFSLVVELNPDKQIVLRADDTNGNWGEEYSFTVPKVLVSETKGSETNTSSQVNKAESKEKTKGSLPSTGATQNTILSVLGILLLFGAVIGYKKKVIVLKK